MKRVLWSIAMVLVAAAFLTPVSPTQGASVCGQECNRNLDCVPECSACDARAPTLPGECVL